MCNRMQLSSWKSFQMIIFPRKSIDIYARINIGARLVVECGVMGYRTTDKRTVELYKWAVRRIYC